MDVTFWFKIKDQMKSGIICTPLQYYKNPSSLCTYMNIQMLNSTIGLEYSVLDIQSLIESAWDGGVDPMGKAHLHRLRNTKKWIGSTEMVVFYKSINKKTTLYDFPRFTLMEEVGEPNPVFVPFMNSKLRHCCLINFLIDYYTNDIEFSIDTVSNTSKIPLHLQFSGHCVLIIGFELYQDQLWLLTFDCDREPTGRTCRRSLEWFNGHSQYSVVLVDWNQLDDGKKQLSYIKIPN